MNHTPLWLSVAGALVALSIGCDDDETTAQGTNTTGTGNAGGDGGSGAGFTSGNAGGGQGGTAAEGGGGSGVGGDITGAPGTLTIVVDDLAGADGKFVLSSVLDGSDKLAATCMQLAGDPASAQQVAGEVNPNDPCDIGAEVVLPGGLVRVASGIYTGGTPAPEQCASSNVVVDGDTEFTLTGWGACN